MTAICKTLGNLKKKQIGKGIIFSPLLPMQMQSKENNFQQKPRGNVAMPNALNAISQIIVGNAVKQYKEKTMFFLYLQLSFKNKLLYLQSKLPFDRKNNKFEVLQQQLQQERDDKPIFHIFMLASHHPNIIGSSS